ncbi:MAG TPA: DUF4230 domain-containing protein, partial [Terriglobales bacterium]|nr:DUF4230 domain-containing protein [Terriglobales bacterium]
TGLFTPADPELEGQVREAAVDQMRAAALDDGILQTAATNARQTIKSLLTSLGFTNIEIRP